MTTQPSPRPRQLRAPSRRAIALRVITPTACGFALYIACCGASVLAAPITGPGGEITGATTTTTLINNAGGCTGSGAANCSIDGNISGNSNSFVEFGFSNSETFTYSLNGLYSVSQFLLWNDRGQPDSGIGNFDLVFKNTTNNTTVGTFSSAAIIPSFNSPTPEVFNFSAMPPADQIDLVINSTLNMGAVSVTQFREVAFDGSQVPEPATGMLLCGGLASIVFRRRR